MNLILKAIFGLTIVQGKYFWPIATIALSLSNCYTTKQTKIQVPSHLLPIFSPHPSIIHFSSISHPPLVHSSPISYSSLTDFSPMSHPSLTYFSPISQPFLTHFTSWTKFNLVLFDLISYLHFFQNFEKIINVDLIGKFDLILLLWIFPKSFSGHFHKRQIYISITGTLNAFQVFLIA